MTEYTGIFKSRYDPLTGKDWIRTVESEDRAVFVQIGLESAEHGRLGGIARAATARRDYRGRMIADAGPLPVRPTPAEREQADREKWVDPSIDF
jgi:hypothetical protein